MVCTHICDRALRILLAVHSPQARMIQQHDRSRIDASTAANAPRRSEQEPHCTERARRSRCYAILSHAVHGLPVAQPTAARYRS